MNNNAFYSNVEENDLPNFGLKTLYVIGFQEVDDILHELALDDYQAIYFGADNSFDARTPSEWDDWEEVIDYILSDNHEYWCLLSMNLACVDDFHYSGFNSYPNFVPIINIEIPSIHKFNSNAIIDINDDHSQYLLSITNLIED